MDPNPKGGMAGGRKTDYISSSCVFNYGLSYTGSGQKGTARKIMIKVNQKDNNQIWGVRRRWETGLKIDQGS